MSDQFCPRFGSILEEDAEVIEATLTELSSRGLVKWLEIGMFRGGTGAGVYNFLAERNVALEWWGIDAGFITEPTSPFPGANVIKGRSEEVYMHVPDGFDAIFIDGCHCRNHIVLDTFNYAPKVRPGGFLLFHDCGKSSQGIDKQPCGPLHLDFCVSTLAGLDLIKFPWPEWTLFMERQREGFPLGGTRSYRRRR